MTVELTTQTYNEFIAASTLPVLVDFWAPWCGPCKMLSPILDQISEEYSDRLVIAKVNTDQNTDIGTLLKGVSLRSIPTLLVYNADGAVVGTIIGAKAKGMLIAEIGAALGWEDDNR